MKCYPQYLFEKAMQIVIKIQEYFIILLGLCLIVIHGLWPNQFYIDGITIAILVIISIPFLAQFLKKAKIIGAEFEFKDVITATEKLVDLSIKNASESDKKDDKIPKLYFEVFDLTSVKDLLEPDPVLALAALRIEIEKKLRLAAYQLGVPEKNQFSFTNLLGSLKKKEVFRYEQIEAIQKIRSMCNKAIHGSDISKEEAEKIVELAEKLNESFSVGYSVNFNPNTDYENQGLFCEWEHCIEHFPLSEKPNEKSCPVFGHDCPGGVDHIKKCGKSIEMKR